MNNHFLSLPLDISEVDGNSVDTLDNFNGNALAVLFVPCVKRVDISGRGLREYVVLVKRK
ncbi:hypothetical protein CZ787_17795 [Halomonas citrativorans]|uniref:Uncharacterized protein n=1 Tax=Halomonas citrativorans TaxID=2742612 RepID=A0A1R4I5L1_9GAMM|nr:hypothetical protein CZ787_17795 [Halomonas citrativorans]